MKINSISGCSFTGENKHKSNLKPFLYPLLSGAGALVGYSIPIKEIDGTDMINNMGINLSLRKTKVPNDLGKWKNALAGAFIGTGIMLVADLITNNSKAKK